MKQLFILSILLSSFGAYSNSEKQLSKKEYVEKWRTTAVQQMIQFKIPASITLAQAILESGSGNSELARKGNNHFGIKCHDWTGATMFIDDDNKGECFRVYTSADESYVDHSEFLVNKKRYQNLFNLEQTDYEGWAKGLKEAGYATNPKYAQLLIDLIKDLKLDDLDKLGIQNNVATPSIAAVAANSTIQQKRQVWNHENKVKYIVAQRGDTYYRISKEFGVALWQLYKYNDFGPKKDVLEEGDLVYIQPKRHRSKRKSITITESITVNELAQIEAVYSTSIMRKNDIDSPDRLLQKGEKIILR
jgi:LysM repeat protein